MQAHRPTCKAAVSAVPCVSAADVMHGSGLHHALSRSHVTRVYMRVWYMPSHAHAHAHAHAYMDMYMFMACIHTCGHVVMYGIQRIMRNIL